MIPTLLGTGHQQQKGSRRNRKRDPQIEDGIVVDTIQHVKHSGHHMQRAAFLQDTVESLQYERFAVLALDEKVNLQPSVSSIRHTQLKIEKQRVLLCSLQTRTWPKDTRQKRMDADTQTHT